MHENLWNHMVFVWNHINLMKSSDNSYDNVVKSYTHVINVKNDDFFHFHWALLEDVVLF